MTPVADARAITAAEIRWTLAETSAPATSRHVADDPLLADLADALVDAQAYRLIAQQAIHYSHHLQQELRRERDRHHALIDEYRAFRVRVLERDAS